MSLPHSSLVVVEFSEVSDGVMLLNPKYAGMLKNEGYFIYGDNANDAELYYLGAKRSKL